MTTNGESHGRWSISAPPCNRTEADALLNDLLRERGRYTETRFIHEIIQNADDNAYGKSATNGKLPTFSLSLRIGRTDDDLDTDNANPGNEYILETTCNEDGFSMLQIAALTDIEASTKTKCKDVHGGFTGEKGVGFKTVFRIANVVHVSSGHYNFKLDNRHGMIGALRPIPCPFPASKFTSDSTRMMVQLKGQREHEVIERDLIDAQPEILLFLRRLRRISVNTSALKTVYTATHNDDDKEFHGETRAVTLHHGPEETRRITKYIIVRKIVDNMPTEPRRESVVTSELTLAFPLEGNGSPRTFLIQGDFILKASRESIAHTAWNERLQETIPGAFEAAIHRFNETKGVIRYSWPQYLEYSTTGIAFGKDLRPNLFKHLSSCRILRSRHSLDVFFMSGDLVFVPPEYRLDGEPLIESPLQCQKHLAFDYAPKGKLLYGLAALGVKAMDIVVFSSHFVGWPKSEKPNLGLKTLEWHSKVALAILATDWKSKAMLRRLPIIPTLYGEFVPASTEYLHMVSSEDAWDAPGSLGLKFVDLAARSDPQRETLFRWFGIPESKAFDICNRILCLHAERDPRSREEVVEEIIYLFQNRKLIDQKRLANLWFATIHEQRPSRARSVCFIDPEIQNNLVVKYALNPSAPVRVLLPDYFENALTRMDAGEDDETGSKEDSRDDTELEVEEKISKPKNEFFEWLKNSCKLSPLPRLTFMDKALPEACPNLNFLELPEPEKKNCKMLSAFSVVVEPSWVSHLRELQAIRQYPLIKVCLEDVRRKYQFLSMNRAKILTDTCNRIRDDENGLIYHPQRGWITVKDCVWETPKGFESTVAIAQLYPECGDFFKGNLKMHNAGVPEAVQELGRLAKAPDDATKTETLKAILLTLSQYLKEHRPRDKDSMANSLQYQLRRLKVFPMMHQGEASTASTRVFKSLEDTWYVNDRSILVKAFFKRVDTLDFDVQDMDRIMPLVEWLGIENRPLSKAVSERKSYEGMTQTQLGWSDIIQKKASFIALLGQNPEQTVPTFEVSRVSVLRIERTLDGVRGKAGVGHISIDKQRDFIRIIVRRNPFKDLDLRVERALVEFFSCLFSINDVNRIPLVSQILKVDLSETRELLEEVDVRCPLTGSYDLSGHSLATVKPEDTTRVLAFETATVAAQPIQSFTAPCASEIVLSQRQKRFEGIGLKAEAHVNDFFETRIPDWDSKTHWTSHLREVRGYPAFCGDESTMADFTYTDKGGEHMLPVLQKLGVLPNLWCRQTITYHFEVKGTVFGCEEPFRLSQKQMDLARKYACRGTDTPSDIFFVARVYNVETTPNLRVYRSMVAYLQVSLVDGRIEQWVFDHPCRELLNF
ncbi:hypothetical protein CTA2_11383 [Colletotrichum tanaceti]|uniref:Protein NO VEIN C-terminal domain-containing protein n=1 Tax=Colletotrichum tanaceti TaxID=1306861 RepID=A0A4U6X5C1_9PEZI|nr:hypothetical protein CTA2_11383 [Colletotrichum tanaceti]TKW50622.1 hypothetical protein CTA1_1347 [Colletotrichum tanaceti]